MKKFVVIAMFLTFIVCLITMASGLPQRADDANEIIHKIIGQYEARIKGPSIVYPEQPAHVIDPHHLHLHI